MGFAAFLLVFGASILLAQSARHSLYYTYTALSKPVPNPGIHDFTAMGMLDDRQIDYYNSKDQLKIPKQHWMEEKMQADYWEKGTQSRQSKEKWFNVNIDILIERMRDNATDVHVLQWRHGCEIDANEKGLKFLRGVDEYSYDGDTFLAFDDDTAQWVAPVLEALPTKRKWDGVSILNQYTKGYLEKECVDWLSKFMVYGDEELRKQSPPDVRVFAKKANTPDKLVLTCMATGFVPKYTTMDIKRNMVRLTTIDGVKSTGIRPNEDESHQLRKSVEIDEADTAEYDCVVNHVALEKPVNIRWDRSCNDCTKAYAIGGIIGGIIGAVVGVVFGIGIGIGCTIGIMVFWRKYKNANRPNPPEVEDPVRVDIVLIPTPTVENETENMMAGTRENDSGQGSREDLPEESQRMLPESPAAGRRDFLACLTPLNQIIRPTGSSLVTVANRPNPPEVEDPVRVDIVLIPTPTVENETENMMAGTRENDSGQGSREDLPEESQRMLPESPAAGRRDFLACLTPLNQIIRPTGSSLVTVANRPNPPEVEDPVIGVDIGVDTEATPIVENEMEKMMAGRRDNDSALVTKRKWGGVSILNQYTKGYLEKECVDWLSIFMVYGDKELRMQSPPDVRVFAKKANTPDKLVLTCMATGFLPKDITMNIKRNMVRLTTIDGVKSTEVRPNEDDSHQLRKSVEIDEADTAEYECEVTHRALQKPVNIRWGRRDNDSGKGSRASSEDLAEERQGMLPESPANRPNPPEVEDPVRVDIVLIPTPTVENEKDKMMAGRRDNDSRQGSNEVLAEECQGMLPESPGTCDNDSGQHSRASSEDLAKERQGMLPESPILFLLRVGGQLL